MQQKIVLIGGPGTGKSSIVNQLTSMGYDCMPEISRAVTLRAREQGIEQLFVTDPLLFSKMLLEGRQQQYVDANKLESPFVFFDRGIPDVYAYLEFVKSDYPPFFKDTCKDYPYDKVFVLPPWKEIYTSDNERYETFEQALVIQEHLEKAYSDQGYELHTVPFGSIETRTNFILEALQMT